MLLRPQVRTQVGRSAELGNVVALDHPQRAHQQVRRFQKPLFRHQRFKLIRHITQLLKKRQHTHRLLHTLHPLPHLH